MPKPLKVGVKTLVEAARREIKEYSAAEAIALARPGAKDLAEDIARRLAHYQRRQVYREPS